MVINSKSTSPSAGAFRAGGATASNPIDWATAVQMINAYRQNCNHLYTYYQKAGSDCVHKAILQGFQVDVDALQSLINGELTGDISPDEIFISFGVAPECLEANPEDQGFTVLLSGIKFDDEKDTCGKILTATDTPVLEYSHPCPPCSINIAQHLRIFPGSLPCCGDCYPNAKCDDCVDAQRSTLFSSPIDWKTAVQMMNAYRENCNHLYTYYQKEGSACTHRAILQGFRVSVTALQSLINGEYTDDIIPDSIFIGLAVAKECLAANPEDQGFTILLCGVKEVTGSACGEIITTGDTPVLDYLDPCPDKCPANLARELSIYPGSLPCCEDCISNSNCQDCQDDIPQKE